MVIEAAGNWRARFHQQSSWGYHYNVKERGSTLSSGQRQLIAFLRAFVSRPSVNFDEATLLCGQLFGGAHPNARIASLKVVPIVIAHRLATIQKADKICCGSRKIVERGRHAELIKSQRALQRLVWGSIHERISIDYSLRSFARIFSSSSWSLNKTKSPSFK